MRLTRKQKRMLVYSLIGLLFVFAGSLFPQEKQPPVSAEAPLSPTITAVQAASEEASLVDRVIDGDTIDVFINGEIKRIRMIGLNTPETKDPRRPVECFGKEASAYLTQLVEGKVVRLESDESQDRQDRYGRLLRYVFIDDINVNREMILQGYGYEYTYENAYRYQSEFKSAQQEAEQAKRGLWGDAGCALN